MTIGFFEAKVIIRVGLVNQLFEQYKLINKITCYMKDEGKRLPTMTTILKLNVSCQDLGIHAPFEGFCFGNALFKACQFASTNKNMQILVCN
jgi:hypothetical protein